jgi:phosphatidylinositol 4-kinase type 2
MVSHGKHDSYRGSDIKLFVKDVKEGKKRPIEVRSWATIKDVKDSLSLLMDIPVTSIRLYFGPLLTSGRELPNHRTLHDAGIYRSGETLLLDIKSTSDLSFSATPFSKNLRPSNDICISSSMVDSTPKYLRSLVTQARRGLSLGLKPDLIMEGSGGTYVLRDSRKAKIGVFKPADEEPYAENNPRGYLLQDGQTMSLRAGIVPGEACMREVAAYLLDKDGFSGVPMTTLVEARHPAFNTNGSHLSVSQGGASIGAHSIAPNSPVKSVLVKKPGSFQEFVRYECTIDDVSPSMISAEEVHKIAILDIRIMNADRNAANLLVCRKPDNTLELVPIDHGYCLRSVCDVSWMDWCWLDWPQLKEVRYAYCLNTIHGIAFADLCFYHCSLLAIATKSTSSNWILMQTPEFFGSGSVSVRKPWTISEHPLLCSRRVWLPV